MKIEIFYDQGLARVTEALNPRTGEQMVLKGIKAKLQQHAKSDGYVGLEFWFYNHGGYNAVPGTLLFEIFDPFGRVKAGRWSEEERRAHGWKGWGVK